jgi:hypothetical protein
MPEENGCQGDEYVYSRGSVRQHRDRAGDQRLAIVASQSLCDALSIAFSCSHTSPDSLRGNLTSTITPHCRQMLGSR